MPIIDQANQADRSKPCDIAANLTPQIFRHDGILAQPILHGTNYAGQKRVNFVYLIQTAYLCLVYRILETLCSATMYCRGAKGRETSIISV